MKESGVFLLLKLHDSHSISAFLAKIRKMKLIYSESML